MLKFYDKDGEEVTFQSTQFCDNPACLGEPWCSSWGICKGSAEEAKQQPQQEISGSGLEQEYDSLILELSQQFQQDELHLQQPSTTLIPELPPAPAPSSPTPPPCSEIHSSTAKKPYKKQRFASTSKEEVEAARKASMPQKTRNDMEYCMRVWKEWRKSTDSTAEITSLTKVELDEALSRLVGADTKLLENCWKTVRAIQNSRRTQLLKQLAPA